MDQLIMTIFGVLLAIVLILLFAGLFIQPAFLILPFSRIMGWFVKNPPYPDMEKYFPEHEVFKKNYHVFKEELFQILEHHESEVPMFHQVDNIQRFISARDDIPWRTFVLKAYGEYVESNCKLAPKSAQIIRKLPRVTTAMFSIIEGGKKIPPHFGFYKGVLRYHLALVVPEDAPCYIIVGGKKYQWVEGEDVLLDDTYVHSVYNESKHKRVVLFCDVFRDRDVPAFLDRLNRKMYNMLSKSKRLEKAMKKAEVATAINA